MATNKTKKNGPHRFSNSIFLGLITIILLLVSLQPKSFAADLCVIADIQSIKLTPQQYLLSVTASGAQAFDVLPPPNPTTVLVRLHQSKLGKIPPLGTTPFGTVTLTQETTKRVLLKIVFANAGYSAKVSQGDNSNSVDIRIQFTPDTTAPVISAVSVKNITSTGATITWTTNEASDTQTAYGLTQPESIMSALNSSKVTSHSVVLSGLVPGKQYFYHVRSKDAAGNLAKSSTSIFSTLALSGPAFKDAGGKITIEAENYDSNIPRGGKSWSKLTTQAGYSGTGYLSALPNTGVLVNTGFVGNVTELVYRINVQIPGTYYVWLRLRAPTTSDDTIHAGLNGASPASADRISAATPAWTWIRSTMDNVPASINIPTAGVHTFHLWMREDGIEIDKIYLTNANTATSPAGLGPVESSRA